MARARNIKPGFFSNDELVELPFEFRLLFIGLWTIADREGRMIDRPKKIKMEIFPSDNVDCDEGLRQLEKRGFIARYTYEDHTVIEILNFIKHQAPHTTERDSTLPDRNGLFKVNVRHPKTKGITGEFRLLTGEQLKNNVKQPLEPVNPSTHNALNPDSGFLNPDCGILNPDSLNPESGKKPLSEQSPDVPEIPPIERRGIRMDEVDGEESVETAIVVAQQPRGNAGDAVRAVFTYWQQALSHPRAQLDAKRQKAIKARLKDGYSVQDLCLAVDGCGRSAYHMGQNESGTVYDDIELICRDGPKVDSFIKKASIVPAAIHRTSAQQQTINNLNAYLENEND